MDKCRLLTSPTSHLVRAAEVAGTFPLVRTTEGNLAMIGEALDVGAGGVVVPQVASERRAVEKLDEILQVDGVDVLFVGPYDLPQSLGVVGQVDHPLVVETITRIVSRCVEKGVCAGAEARS